MRFDSQLTQVVQDGRAGKWCCGKGECEDRYGDRTEQDSLTVQRLVAEHTGMAHGRDEQEQTPKNPANPEEDSCEDECDRQDESQAAMQARRDGVKDVSAVELPAGNQVQRSDEETDPTCDENRVA